MCDINLVSYIAILKLEQAVVRGFIPASMRVAHRPGARQKANLRKSVVGDCHIGSPDNNAGKFRASYSPVNRVEARIGLPWIAGVEGVESFMDCLNLGWIRPSLIARAIQRRSRGHLNLV